MFVDILHCLLKSGPISFAIDHSPCARMTVTLAKGSILWRCQSPYHRHQWQTCLCAGWTVVHPRVSPFLLPTFHQISTLEKTASRHCPILSSLMSWRPSQVSPFLVAAHSTSSEVFDFQFLFSPGFLMQSKQARLDPLRCIARPNSSSALILLWLVFICIFLCSFRHRFKTIGGTEMANVEQTQKMILFVTCEISPRSVCLRVGFWCQCIWFGSWGAIWFYQTTNQEQLCGFWKHVSLWDFSPLWSSWSQLRCLQTHTTKLPDEKNARLRK